MEHSTCTLIDFQKDFEDHKRELASEIAGLHNDGLIYADDLETLYAFSGFDAKWGAYQPEERE
ncbi:MAG: hypothetical protein D4R93_02365 [Deltaproteobacteria bacterium]|nr:MAG: hypothetical protein D4R93_02365 [Deltaproteobacteria bacterium]